MSDKSEENKKAGIVQKVKGITEMQGEITLTKLEMSDKSEEYKKAGIVKKVWGVTEIQGDNSEMSDKTKLTLAITFKPLDIDI